MSDVGVVIEIREYVEFSSAEKKWEGDDAGAVVDAVVLTRWADHIEWQEGRYTNLVGSFHDKQELVERLQAEVKGLLADNTRLGEMIENLQTGDSNERA